jgi:hypothetical protein
VFFFFYLKGFTRENSFGHSNSFGCAEFSLAFSIHGHSDTNTNESHSEQQEFLVALNPRAGGNGDFTLTGCGSGFSLDSHA